MLKAIYTYFDVDHNSIELAESSPFKAEKLHLNTTPRYLFIFLGAALALLSIAALMAILKKCPYDPTYVGKPIEKKEEMKIIQTSSPV